MTVSPQRYLLVKAQNAILSPKHTQAPAEVLIDQSTGKIVEIALENKKCTTTVSEGDLEVIQLEDNQLLMPGLVDAHGKTWIEIECGIC
jgi:allantoinase